MTPEETKAKLQEPFPIEFIEWRAQSCGNTANGPWVMVLAYIQARAIQERLDDVFGWDGWTEEYRVSNTDIICRLGVKTDDGWIYKENGASNTDIEAFKGGISGPFKRVAASGYGIGRYLYKLEEAFAECQLIKQTGTEWHKATTRDKKHTIYWKEPRLPAWALPKSAPNSGTRNGQGSSIPPANKPPAGQPSAPSGPKNEEFGRMVDDALKNGDRQPPLYICFKCGEEMPEAEALFCEKLGKPHLCRKNGCQQTYKTKTA